jgi:hypothetical protein
MSEDQEHRNALTAFEAALASLVPQAERLDRERIMYLAGRAAAMAEMGLAEGFREGDDPRRVRACTHVSAHEDATAGVLGSAAKGAGGPPARAARPIAWAWPSAFAAMTAVAASLLVALLMQPGSRVADRVISVQPDAPLAEAPRQDRTPAVPPREVESTSPVSGEQPRARPPWPWDSLVLARVDWQQDRLARAGLSEDGARVVGGTSEPRVPSPKGPTAADRKVIETAPAPVSNRELFESLLKEAGSDRWQAES